jgi:hypothetical protein
MAAHITPAGTPPCEHCSLQGACVRLHLACELFRNFVLGRRVLARWAFASTGRCAPTSAIYHELFQEDHDHA